MQRGCDERGSGVTMAASLGILLESMMLLRNARSVGVSNKGQLADVESGAWVGAGPLITAPPRSVGYLDAY